MSWHSDQPWWTGHRSLRFFAFDVPGRPDLAGLSESQAEPPPYADALSLSAAFRAQTLVRCTLTATGHTSTVGNGSVRPVISLTDQNCPHDRVRPDRAAHS
jgi:hypothetical protein